MQQSQNRPTGMRGFTVVWIGQIVSLLGTAMSNFALTLWAYDVTGRATPLALVGFFFVTPMVVLGPLVGTLVDRGNRKLMMMLSDLAAALTTVIVLVLYATGNLTLTSITAEQDTMPDLKHFSPNSPAGQAPTPDHRRHAHSASPKVLSTSTVLRLRPERSRRDKLRRRATGSNPAKPSQAG